MTIIYIILATAISTLLGGFVAFKYKRYTHIFAGLTAGTLLGVIFFEIIPEIFEMNTGVLPLLTVVIGFIAFHVLEKIFSLHHSHDASNEHNHHHPASRQVAVLALIAHSLLDGLGIGLAFKVSPEFGLLLAIGVIAHDFSDGFNTVSLTKHSKYSKFFLLADALAPMIGILIGLSLTVSENVLGLILGLFAGVLLYVSTGDVLPEAHCEKKSHTLQHLMALVIGVVYISLVVMYLG